MSQRSVKAEDVISLVGNGRELSDAREYSGTVILPPGAILDFVESFVLEAPDGDADLFDIVVGRDGILLDYDRDPADSSDVKAIAGTLVSGAVSLGIRLRKADGSVPSAPTQGSIRILVKGHR
jgi:hypothetical protein